MNHTAAALNSQMFLRLCVKPDARMLDTWML